MHTRKNRQKNGIKVLKHLNGMKLVGNRIDGYVSGPDVEIEYSVDSSGMVTISGSNMSRVNALDYLNRLKSEIMSRVAQGHSTFNPSRTPGHFYLQRSANPGVTDAANAAIAAKLITLKFVHQVVKWNLRVIVGR